MGPDESYTMSSSTVKVVQREKLKADKSNWTVFRTRTVNYATAKGLRRTMNGTARKPTPLVERNGSLYLGAQSLTPLTDAEIEEHDTKVDEYEQKEAQFREIIYETVSKTVFQQIEKEPTAAAVWNKLVELNDNQGDLVIADYMTRLQLMRYNEEDSIEDHTTTMVALRNQLADMGMAITEASFCAYIRTSLSHIEAFQSIFSSIDVIQMTQGGHKLDSAQLIVQIHAKAKSDEVANNSRKLVEAAAMLSSKSSSKDKPKDAKGKSKAGGKPKTKKHCTNCDLDGHIAKDCFAEGGGKADSAPDWWKEKFNKDGTRKNKGKGKEKDTKGKKQEKNSKSAHNASKDDSDSEDGEAHACVTFTDPLSWSEEPEAPTALVCTSEFVDMSIPDSVAANVAAPFSRGIIIDQGASVHFSPEREKFLNYRELSSSSMSSVRTADGHTFQALGKGDLSVDLPMGLHKKPTPMLLKNTYYSPKMAFTLLAVCRLDKAGYELLTRDGQCVIRSPKGTIVGKIPLIHGLYRVSSPRNLSSPITHSANVASKKVTITQLHQIMGHINHEYLRTMIKEGMITGFNLDLDSKPEFCEPCVQAKMTRKSFPKSRTYSAGPTNTYGDYVASDLWGPARVKSLGGSYYFANYKDLHTREEKVYFLSKKSQTYGTYKDYEAWAKTQRGVKEIKIFGCDRGGEFTSGPFDDHLRKAGTVRHLTTHDSPASNGIAERPNRTHLNRARAMMFTSGLPPFLWGEAVRHSVWIGNRSMTRSLKEKKTPHEMATHQKPDLSNLPVWGANVWVKQLKVGKLEPRAKIGHFVGVDDESKGWRVYWPERRKIIIERDVVTDQDKPPTPGSSQIEGENDPFSNPSSSSKTTKSASVKRDLDVKSDPSDDVLEDIAPEDSPSTTQNEKSSKITENPPDNQQDHQPPSNPPSRPLTPLTQLSDDEGDQDQPDPEPEGPAKRARKPAGYYNINRLTRLAATVAEASFEEAAEVVGLGITEEMESEAEWFAEVVESAMVASEDEPSLKEATEGREKSHWLPAIESELTSIEKFKTYTLVNPPKGANIIPCKYTFRRKRGSDGEVVRHKARLVVKGFKERYGVDFIRKTPYTPRTTSND